MHCEDARDALLDSLDGSRDDARTAALDAHLTDCAECRALRQDLARVVARAQVWHELAPPAWNPLATPRPDAAGGGWLAALQTWFAPVASTLALLLALGVYWQAPAGRPDGALPAAYPPDRTAAAGSRSVSADGADGDELLAAARAERQQALEALTALLKAEMDRRSLETEQSLKYIISHQIQSQRQLEAIRSRLADPPAAGEQL